MKTIKGLFLFLGACIITMMVAPVVYTLASILLWTLAIGMQVIGVVIVYSAIYFLIHSELKHITTDKEE